MFNTGPLHYSHTDEDGYAVYKSAKPAKPASPSGQGDKMCSAVADLDAPQDVVEQVRQELGSASPEQKARATQLYNKATGVLPNVGDTVAFRDRTSPIHYVNEQAKVLEVYDDGTADIEVPVVRRRVPMDDLKGTRPISYRKGS